MIAPMNPSEPERTSGAGDGTHLSPVQQNKITAMMLNPRRRWKLSKAAKNEAMAATINNMGDEDGRVRNAAVANLIRMEAQNQSDQHKAIDKHVPDLHEVGGTIEHRVGVETLFSDPEYVNYLRHRTVTEDCDAGAVCQIREPGNGKPVANGKAHGDPRPGTNGHRNGSE